MTFRDCTPQRTSYTCSIYIIVVVDSASTCTRPRPPLQFFLLFYKPIVSRLIIPLRSMIGVDSSGTSILNHAVDAGTNGEVPSPMYTVRVCLYSNRFVTFRDCRTSYTSSHHTIIVIYSLDFVHRYSLFVL